MLYEVITLIIASDSKRNNILTINDEQVSEFITTGENAFEKITIKNIYIRQGLSFLSIKEVTGGIDIDYIEIKSSADISKITFNDDYSLINQSARNNFV